MNPQDLSEEIFSLEADLDLLEQKVADVYFWERIRFPIYNRLLTHSSDSESLNIDENDSRREYALGIKLMLKNLLSKNPFLASDADLLFYGTGRRKKLQDGLWRDIHIDPFVDEIAESDLDALCLERPFELSHSKPVKTPRLRYTDLIEYTGTVMQKTGVSTVSFSEDEISLLKTIESKILSRFGIELVLTALVREDH
jgi:hypothetical protein